MALYGVSEGRAVAAAAAAAAMRSHVGGQGGARMVGLGIRRGARSSSTAPRCVATNLRQVLNSIRPTTTSNTVTTTFRTPITFAVANRLSTARSQLDTTTTSPNHTRREYATMASATTFYEFKPKDSTFTLSYSPIFLPSSYMR